MSAAVAYFAASSYAFAFRHAPQREDVAWFVARVREGRNDSKPGQYAVAWSDRGGGEVHSVDLGNDLCNEEWFVVALNRPEPRPHARVREPQASIHRSAPLGS
jgi:hypothetical protein